MDNFLLHLKRFAVAGVLLPAMLMIVGCYRHVVGVEGEGNGTYKIYEPNLKEPGDKESSSSKTVPSKTVSSKRAQ